MKRPSRRTFLGAAAAAPVALSLGCKDKGGGDSGDSGAGAGAPERGEEPGELEPDGTLDETTAFAWGVQVGDVETDGAVVSVWTTETQVSLRLWRAEGTEWTEVDGVEGLLRDEEADEVRVITTLTGLEPDTAYCVVAYAADGSTRSRPARFRTALSDDDWRVVTVAATSCFKHNQPWPSLSHVAAERIDALLLLGDVVYADSADTLDEYRAYYSDALSTGGLMDICASTSLVATWDDHEISNNLDPTDIDPDKLEAAITAFKEALPQREQAEPHRIWRSQRWGEVLEIFVLDCRTERIPDEGVYISEEQQTWLLEGLASSPARFKLIMNSVPITDMEGMMGTVVASDRWQGYPEQRTAVLHAIEDAGVTGVLWVAGDFHFSMIAHLDEAGGIAEDRYEVLAGVAGSDGYLPTEFYDWDSSEQYILGFTAWNTTVFRFDPGTGVCDIRFVGDDGAEITTYSLSL